jgi:hypothetical protein
LTDCVPTTSQLKVRKNRVKRPAWIDALVFIVLVTAGVQLRIALEYLPNFAPVAALALFAGYFFRSRIVGMAVPMSIMLISDAYIGRYAWYQMVVVYGMLALPVLMRGFLRKHLSLQQSGWKQVAISFAGLLACSFASSVLFFLATNAVCLGWYEPTIAGVAKCYWQALPFFRYTLTGDALFAVLTFGLYAAACHWSMLPSTRNDVCVVTS